VRSDRYMIDELWVRGDVYTIAWHVKGNRAVNFITLFMTTTTT